eukprot:6464445-Amphidinium_carterae.3
MHRWIRHATCAWADHSSFSSWAKLGLELSRLLMLLFFGQPLPSQEVPRAAYEQAGLRRDLHKSVQGEFQLSSLGVFTIVKLEQLHGQCQSCQVLVWKDQLHYLIGYSMNAVLLAHVFSFVFARVFSFPLVSMASLWERWAHFEGEFQQPHQRMSWSARFKGVTAPSPPHSAACLSATQRFLVHALRFVAHRGMDVHVGTN